MHHDPKHRTPNFETEPRIPKSGPEIQNPRPDGCVHTLPSGKHSAHLALRSLRHALRMPSSDVQRPMVCAPGGEGAGGRRRGDGRGELSAPWRSCDIGNESMQQKCVVEGSGGLGFTHQSHQLRIVKSQSPCSNSPHRSGHRYSKQPQLSPTPHIPTPHIPTPLHRHGASRQRRTRRAGVRGMAEGPGRLAPKKLRMPSLSRPALGMVESATPRQLRPPPFTVGSSHFPTCPTARPWRLSPCVPL